jgi:hypothetical protein
VTPDLTDAGLDGLLEAFAELAPRRLVTFRGRSLDSTFGGEGQVVVTRDVTATSRSVAVATENFTAPALYVVVGRTGRAVEHLSRFPGEQEVVFLPGAVFTVVKSARIDDLPVTIVEQLDPEAAGPDEPYATLAEVGLFAVQRVGRAREAGPVEITTPGKFLGDIA